MDKKIAEAIGLLRHQIISPVLMDTGQSQMKYFKSITEKVFEMPSRGPKTFKATTMKGWLNNYKKHGFKGLVPNIRTDNGGYRKIDIKTREQILEFRKNNLEISVVRFYKKCLEEQTLGRPPICLATLRRFLKAHDLAKPRCATMRKRFEMSIFGELWTGDFMHGPKVKVQKNGQKEKKAILFAVIDDHSRMIVGSEFALQESTIQVEDILKNALLTHGLPDRIYLDNGASFSSNYLARTCANLGIGIVHSKPYDSPSRGKIERFFRTVREGFLVQYKDGQLTLEELNSNFKIWLRDDYHRNYHQGIKARPIDRYNTSVMNYPRKKIDLHLLNEYFMICFQRKVKKDSTVSLNGKLYETPARYIGRTIELKHVQGDDSEIFIYEEDKKVTRIVQLDAVENGRSYRPTKVNHISMSGGEPC
jgi:putative transposase